MDPKPVPTATALTEPFWKGARDGALRLQQCASCDALIHPPKRWCPKCWSTSLRHTDLAGDGRVVSFTLVHQGPIEAFSQDAPYVVALVRLDEGPTMLANIISSGARDIAIGARVIATFEERGGVVMPQFRPADA